MTQRRIPIRSTKLRAAAVGQPCTIEFLGICSHDPATTVLAHVHDETFGKGMKADDTSGVHACHNCHMAYDLHRTGLTEAEVLGHILRAYQRTIRNLVNRGIILLPLDVEKPMSEKPTPPRKPRAERQPIQTRGFQQGPAQKIPSRPFPQRAKK